MILDWEDGLLDSHWQAILWRELVRPRPVCIRRR